MTPWQLVLLDSSDQDDPRWLLVTVQSAESTGPAPLDMVSPPLGWLRQQVGDDTATTVPLLSQLAAWRVERGSGEDK